MIVEKVMRTSMSPPTVECVVDGNEECHCLDQADKTLSRIHFQPVFFVRELYAGGVDVRGAPP
ncbi:hypothetical protein BN2537_615 [Streptomyces venezuelae]|nr:hypothetical protein BN2537_615 [Streptomyces venezuelae]